MVLYKEKTGLDTRMVNKNQLYFHKLATNRKENIHHSHYC